MRDLVCTCRGEWPKTSMRPLVGFNKPSSSFTVVDLPEPFGPSKPNTSPRRTSKSTLSTARALGRFQKSLNTFVNPRTETTTSSNLRFAISDCGFDLATGIKQTESAHAMFGISCPDASGCEPEPGFGST